MALQFLDSFDHYSTGQGAKKWTAGSPTIVAGLHGNGGRGFMKKGIVFGSTTIIVECYLKRVGSPSFLVELYDAGDFVQVTSRYQGDGAIEVWRGAHPEGSGLLGRSAPDTIRADQWYHLGVRVKVDRTAGELEVRVNGAPVIGPLTGLNTTNIASSSPGIWSGTVRSFTVFGTVDTAIIDDLVVMDDVDDGINDGRLPGGGGFDKFLGPVEILVKRPNDVGLANAWTPSPAGPNWQNVDDVTPDDDTTYNGADVAAVGASDLFAMEDLAVDQDVVAVQSLVLARKTEEGVAAIATLTHDGGVTTPGATVYQPNTYSYMHAAQPTRPGGGLWNKAAWDAVQVGYRRIA